MAYTLGDLKSRIADDLARSDLSAQISNAITDAIEHYKTTRFYFNEKTANNLTTFSTVVAQAYYTSADSPDIPLFFEIDDIFCNIGGINRPLRLRDADTLQLLIRTNLVQGDPYDWAWMGDQLIFYPLPNAVRTITMMGAYEIPAPTSDTDSTNVWISEAFELIRCYAKFLLFGHVIRDMDQAGDMAQLAQLALGKLEAKTSLKRATGRVAPTEF